MRVPGILFLRDAGDVAACPFLEGCIVWLREARDPCCTV